MRALILFSRLRAGIVFPALVLALGCHSNADPPAAAPSPSSEGALMLGEPRVHSLGELAVARDYTMSMESDRECTQDSPFAPRRGFVKLGIEVSIEGTSSVEVPVNPFYAALYSPTGDIYASTLAGCEPELPAVRVTAGKKARGFVTFEIPAGARKLELRYAPTIIGRDAEELTFAVAR